MDRDGRFREGHSDAAIQPERKDWRKCLLDCVTEFTPAKIGLAEAQAVL